MGIVLFVKKLQNYFTFVVAKISGIVAKNA